MSGKDQPLVCRVEGEELVIRIGIDTLAHGASHRPLLHMSDAFVIADKKQLARDVAGVLNYATKDGFTVTDLIEEAIVDAFEAGSIAFEDME